MFSVDCFFVSFVLKNNTKRSNHFFVQIASTSCWFYMYLDVTRLRSQNALFLVYGKYLKLMIMIYLFVYMYRQILFDVVY